jgi:hypothetical protein
MLDNYIFEDLSQGWMETAHVKLVSTYYRLQEICDSQTELFVRTRDANSHIAKDGFICFHLAFVTRTEAVDGQLDLADWFYLGNVHGWDNVKIRKLGQLFEEFDALDGWAFGHKRWVPNSPPGPSWVDVAVPAQFFKVVEQNKEDILEDVGRGWATLSAGGFCVRRAYLQILADGRGPRGFLVGQ